MGIIYFVILIGVIVTVHEFGHFIAAKTFNVYVPEFSIGMGPAIYQKQKGETKYTVRALPVGGFVAMAGENDDEVFPDVPPERTIKGIAYWKRLVIMLAGIFNNMVLAFILLFVVYANIGYRVVYDPVLADVLVGSVAEEAGIKAGDRMVKATFVDGTSVTINDYNEYMNASLFYNDDEPITFVFSRDNVEYEVTLTKTLVEGQEAPMFGFSFLPTRVPLTVLEAIPYAFSELKGTLSTIVMSISKLIRGRGLNNLSGPVGIYEVTSQSVSYGFINYLYLIAMLSANVGFMNLLPLPMLDGGQVVITIGEMLARRPLNQKIKTGLMAGSMALLLGLMLIVTYNDILKMIIQ